MSDQMTTQVEDADGIINKLPITNVGNFGFDPTQQSAVERAYMHTQLSERVLLDAQEALAVSLARFDNLNARHSEAIKLRDDSSGSVRVVRSVHCAALGYRITWAASRVRLDASSLDEVREKFGRI